MSEKRITVWVQRFKDRSTLVLQWIDPETGKRKSRSAGTGDERKAEEARGDLESDLNNGRYQEASRMTWERFRELFEDQYVAPLRPGTRKVYANAFNLFERVCNPRQLRSVTERTVSAFAAGLRKLPARAKGGGTMQPSTVRARLQFLHTALQWAAGQGLLPRCPKFPEVKVPKKRPQPVPAESFERLLAKAPDATMRAFLLCGWLAGLRIKEALSLEWEPTDAAPWLDLAADRIRVPAVFSKAAEDQWVPLDPELRAALDALPRQGRHVFPFVLRTGRRIQPNDLSARVSKLARSAGVRLTYHSLRKGFGCRYAGKVPAQVLQRLMRHSNVSITMAFYANVDDAVVEAVLGTQRNGSCNNPAPDRQSPAAGGDVNPCEEGATEGGVS
ncbi:MAG TPA: site-specific integrase [Gemmataceae bacterium]|nr:site-specific integrase [Gemmataceae bacterium]